MHELADAIKNALSLGKRVVVEHFDLIYPILERNADILIGVGQEVVITRPNLFGPEPGDIAEAVFKSIEYRKRAHTAEDLVEIFVQQSYHGTFLHRDVPARLYHGLPRAAGYRHQGDRGGGAEAHRAGSARLLCR